MEGGGRMISVDRWREESQAYFLTHLHSDHTSGLTPRWSRGPLYCSPVSARLLPSRFPGFDLSLVRVLEIGTTYSIPLVSIATGLRVSVQVTPIDAHHCPGAVMYLFKGEFGCILHTGDFRWESTSKRAYKAQRTLLKALSGDKVDLLYLDNTYCHPSYLFPSRDGAAQQVIDVINLYPDHDIVIGIDKLGKEELLLKIARALNVKIWVWPERLQTMHILALDDIFTTRTSLTRIRAVPRYSLTVATLAALNKIHPTIGIMPSGLTWDMKLSNEHDAPMTTLPAAASSGSNQSTAITPWSEMKQSGSVKRHGRYIYTIPYSDHSCFSEIRNLVELVQPAKITGIVSSSVCYTHPGQYFGCIQGGKLPDELRCGVGRSMLDPRLRIIHLEPIKKRHKISKEHNDSVDEIPRTAVHMVRRSRVSLLRRDRRGVKLFEAENAYCFDADVLHARMFQCGQDI